MKHIMKHFSFPGILFPLALWACPAANAQTVVATDETLKTQVFEITGWDMGTNDHWWAFPAPVFDCRKIASVSVAIQSDIINNGRPDIFPMAKLSRLVDNGNAGEKGGHSEIQCFNDNPSWLEISMRFSLPSVFRFPLYKFNSATARRGWVRWEYWQ